MAKGQKARGRLESRSQSWEGQASGSSMRQSLRGVTDLRWTARYSHLGRQLLQDVS